MIEAPSTESSIQRVRHELRRHELSVVAVERLTPVMIRVTLSGPELVDFVGSAPDDHLKLFLPVDGGELAMRDYTPRRYDPAGQQLLIDLVDHDGGPAAAWARPVQPSS